MVHMVSLGSHGFPEGLNEAQTWRNVMYKAREERIRTFWCLLRRLGFTPRALVSMEEIKVRE